MITQQHGTDRTGHIIQNDTQQLHTHTHAHTHTTHTHTQHVSKSAKMKMQCDHYELSELSVLMCFWGKTF